MRYQFYAFILLTVVVFNIFRFQIPYIQYAVFERYIAKELCVKRDVPNNCCHGKCFRDKQVKAINSTHETESTNQQSANSKKYEKTEMTDFLAVNSFLLSITEFYIQFFLLSHNLLHSGAIASIFIPPRC